jgi:hypothetical protein
MRLLRYVLLGALLIFGMVVGANAQTCETVLPPTNFEIGDSYCIQVCNTGLGGLNGQGFFLVGSLSSTIDNFPVLTFTSGCSPLSSNCIEDCDPITVPTGEWVFGGSPYPFLGNYWWMGNECIEFYMKYAHDPGYWDFFFISYCEGCFCMTFDTELPVELMDFSAVAGDGEVALNWSTASESNTASFEIVRDREALVRIPADNSATGAEYSWVDNSVENGQVYNYELYSIDLNGTRTFLKAAEANPTFSVGAVTEYALYQNYPNPFNPETQIAFDLVESRFVTLKVMNLLGQEVVTIANDNFSAGRHVINFNGSDLTSGVYLYTLTAGDFSAAKKLVLLK